MEQSEGVQEAPRIRDAFHLFWLEIDSISTPLLLDKVGNIGSRLNGTIMPDNPSGGKKAWPTPGSYRRVDPALSRLAHVKMAGTLTNQI